MILCRFLLCLTLAVGPVAHAGNNVLLIIADDYGVDVIGVSRSYDTLLAARAVREDAARTSANTTTTSMRSSSASKSEPLSRFRSRYVN